MRRSDYKPRVIDQKVKEYLSAFGAICIEGPKWCGKTWTSSHGRTEGSASSEKRRKKVGLFCANQSLIIGLA